MRNSAVQPSESTVVRGLPDAVPRLILGDVVVHGVVAQHARRIHGELVARAPIVVRIDDDLDLIRRDAHVATAEQPHDAVGMRVVHADERVEILIVVRDLRLRLEARIAIRDGAELPEVR